MSHDEIQRLKNCYRCNNIASSKEHIPPRCIFPAFNDNPIKNFRKNLITVPSCDIHNTEKTKDDEFLLICLASSVQANKYGYDHFKTKVTRAILRKSEEFLNQIVDNYSKLNIVDLEGNNMPILKGKANISRLNECFKSIILGLYYYQFKARFDGELKMVYDFIIPENHNQMSFIKLLKTTFDNDKKTTKVLGDNPQIFKYQFTEKDEYGYIGLKITFYEGLNIYASLKTNNEKEPFNLAMALVNAGIPTTFVFPNDKIEFIKLQEE